jgi:hypothetical protein
MSNVARINWISALTDCTHEGSGLGNSGGKLFEVP